MVASALEEGAEANVGRELIGLVGGVEFEDGVVFGYEAEGCDGLAAVDVEGPDGFAVHTSDCGEETGEGGLGVVIFQYVSVCGREWKGDSGLYVLAMHQMKMGHCKLRRFQPVAKTSNAPCI